MTIYATRTDGPTYAKIIGDNNSGNYPYRIRLNTLSHNGETFSGIKM